MANEDKNRDYDLGIIGLGVMGSNFALNIADHGFTVAGFDPNEEKTHRLTEIKSGHHKIAATSDAGRFCQMLRRPRTILLLVPAGAVVDQVIENLVPNLTPDDLIIDSGNSHFTDTDRRDKELAAKGLLFTGMGISGGESGARRGPSLMPGGSEAGYHRVQPILEAAAAHVGNDACVAYLGPGSAGHYVKMVHNGLEYGLMQLIAETYDLLKRGLGLTSNEMKAVYHRWNQEELSSYLIEITAQILPRKDPLTGRLLLDLILDEARQKGTGQWTVQEALNLQVPASIIDAAVMMRDMSTYKNQRETASQRLTGPVPRLQGRRDDIIRRIRNALFTGMIITYAQGLALLSKASETYRYSLDLETVARIWRGGCIIRAALLEDIRSAYKSNPSLENLLMDEHLGAAVNTRQKDLRDVVRMSMARGLPVPGLASALSYFDIMRSGWLPANLIMAQRDYFGSHTFERIDREGQFHVEWENGKDTQ